MKNKKVFVAVSRSLSVREEIIAFWLIKYGFARTRGDAKKIIYDELPLYEADDRYFIAWRSVSIINNPNLLPKMIEKAMNGEFVAIGCESLPKQYEWACEVVKCTSKDELKVLLHGI